MHARSTRATALTLGPLLAAVAGAVLTAAPAPAAASAGDVYFERSVMAAADARCRLFTPEIGSALRVAQAQARGAALRGGGAEAALRLSAEAARLRAAGVACASPDLAVVASRVRGAFEGYGRLARMSFPGDVAGWNANRTFAVGRPVWRLNQVGRLGNAPMSFGLAGRRGEPAQLLAIADFSGGQTPYSARLVLRDPQRAPDAYLGVMKVSATVRIPLSARTPPRAAARVFTAEGRGDADPALLPPGTRTGTAFRFPPAAAEAIAALDPREAVTVEFLFEGATGSRQAYVEVGDFAAGRAFLTAGR